MKQRPRSLQRMRGYLMRKQGGKCHWCHEAMHFNESGVQPRPPRAVTVDHVVPRWLGGSDDEGNLVAACEECNVRRNREENGGRDLARYQYWLQFRSHYNRGR